MYEMEACEVCRYYKPRDGDPPPSRDRPQRGWCNRYASKRTLSDTWCRWFAWRKKNENNAPAISGGQRRIL